MQKEKNKIVIEFIENTLSASSLYTDRIYHWMNKEGRNLFDMDGVEQEFFRQGKIYPKKEGDDQEFNFEFDEKDGLLRRDFMVPQKEYKNIILCACQKEKQKAKKDRQFEKKLIWLKEILGLNACEFAILRLYAYIRRSHIVSAFLSDIFPQKGYRSEFRIYEHPEVLNRTEARIGQALSPNGRLRRSGVMSTDERNYGLSQRVYEALKNDFTSKDEMKQFLIGQRKTASVPLSEFQFLGNKSFFLQKLLKNAIRTKQKGINILLYGEPGTGKTEFAKTISQAVNAKLYSICDGRTEDHEPERAQRLSSLKISDYLLSKNKGILLFDEAEDIFPGSDLFPFLKPNSSKVFMNDFLENNLHPVIWTTNSTRFMDKAFIRRFTCLIPFENPDKRVRKNIWEKALQTNNLVLPDTDIQSLAECYQVPPAIIASVAKSVKLADGDIHDVKNLLSMYANALNLRYTPKPEQSEAAFDTALLNTDTDMERLTDRLCRNQVKAFSLCLYGAAGTGKSAFARYIAKRMDMDVIEKKASDLLGKYVGETEKHISEAFEMAREKMAMLIFDEADSLLRDRTLAEYSWEATQVNEMLTQMESHPLPFVCTTNLMDRLDKASLRRFTFKVKYDFMTSEQVVNAFRYFFGQDIDAKAVQDLTCLTPGDFVVVKKKAGILGCMDEQQELIAMLSSEMSVKGEQSGMVKMGFV